MVLSLKYLYFINDSIDLSENLIKFYAYDLTFISDNFFSLSLIVTEIQGVKKTPLKFSHGCKNCARNPKISANVLQHLFYQQPNFYLFPFDIFFLTAAHRQGTNIF